MKDGIGSGAFPGDFMHSEARLVYVSREKRPGFKHHKKAGVMNALVRSTVHIPCSLQVLVSKCIAMAGDLFIARQEGQHLKDLHLPLF